MSVVSVSYMQECRELINILRHRLMTIYRPTVADMPQRGNIRILQQNVTATRLRSRASIATNTSEIEPQSGVGGACSKQDKRHTRRLRTSTKRYRNRVRLPKLPKIRYMHCDSNVLFLDANKASHCNNCECLLPINESHCSVSIAIQCLKHQKVIVAIERGCL